MYQLSPTCTRKATLKVQSGGGSPWNGRLACYELLKVLALRKTPPVMHEICPYVRLRAHHAARPSCCHPSLLLKSHRQPPGPVFASWHDEVDRWPNALTAYRHNLARARQLGGSTKCACQNR